MKLYDMTREDEDAVIHAMELAIDWGMEISEEELRRYREIIDNRVKKSKGASYMNYETIIDLDNITLQDCIDMYRLKDMQTVIDDGRVVNFEKEC